MQRITPMLWFDNQAGEAANFYVSVFKKNSKVKQITHYAGEDIPEKKGQVMTVSFELNGQEFTALNPESVRGVQVHRSRLVWDQLRHTGGDRLLLGQTDRGRRPEGATVRLAEGQIRSLVAGRPDAAPGSPEGSGLPKGPASDGRDAPHEEVRYPDTRAGRSRRAGDRLN